MAERPRSRDRVRRQRGGDPYRASQVHRQRLGLESATTHHEACERRDRRYRERQDRLEADRAVNRSFESASAAALARRPQQPQGPPPGVSSDTSGSWHWVWIPDAPPEPVRPPVVLTESTRVLRRPVSPDRSPRRERPTSPSRSPRRERAARGRNSRSPPRSPSSAPPPRSTRTRRVIAAPKPVPSGTTRPSAIRAVDDQSEAAETHSRTSQTSRSIAPTKAAAPIRIPPTRSSVPVAVPEVLARAENKAAPTRPTPPTSEAPATRAIARPKVKETPKAKPAQERSEQVVKKVSLTERTTTLRPAASTPTLRPAASVPVAPAAATSEVEATTSRPLVGLDWHHTLEFRGQVHPNSIEVINRLFDRGFDVAVISYAINEDTPRSVLLGVEQLQRQLRREIKEIVITKRKLLADRELGPSLTGHVGSKAELISLLGCTLYCDDQERILKDIRSFQASRASANRTTTVRAWGWAHASISDVWEAVKDRDVSSFPSADYLIELHTGRSSR